MDISRAGQALLRSRWLATAPYHRIHLQTGPQPLTRTASLSWPNTSVRHVLHTSSAARSYSQKPALSSSPEDDDNPSKPSDDTQEPSSTVNSTANTADTPSMPQRKKGRAAAGLPDNFSHVLYQYATKQPAVPTRARSSAQEAQQAFQNQTHTPYFKELTSGPYGKPKPSGQSDPYSKREFEQKTKFDNGLSMLEFGDEKLIAQPGQQPVLGRPATHLTFETTEEGPPVYPRRNANLGRVVDMSYGKMDLAQGLARMEQLVRYNRVRKLLNQQKFHERPGLKRKRLKSERWRVRFKKGFQHITKRVTRFVNQGW